jgi:uncharacterized Rmd1/YagE family protein
MQRFPLSAHYIKTSLNLAKTEQKNADLPLFRKERNLLVFKLGENQFAAVYAFGVVAVFGIDDKKEIAKLLKRFGRAGEEEALVTLADAATEEYPVIVDPDAPEAVEFDYVRFRQLSIDKLFLVLHVVAQSVALDLLEKRIDETAERYDRIHLNLAQRGALITTRSDIMKTIGFSGNMINFSISQLSLLDKPDIAWEEKEAEALFTNLRKMFELEDRFSALRFKIENIQDSSELMLDVLNSRRAEFLEIIIILLFVLDLVLIFLQKG